VAFRGEEELAIGAQLEFGRPVVIMLPLADQNLLTEGHPCRSAVIVEQGNRAIQFAQYIDAVACRVEHNMTRPCAIGKAVLINDLEAMYRVESQAVEQVSTQTGGYNVLAV